MNISQWKIGDRTFFSLEVDDRLLLVVSAGADPQLANIFADLRGGPVAPGAQSLRQVWRLDQERYSVLQFPGKKEAEKILLEETNFICSRTVT